MASCAQRTQADVASREICFMPAAISRRSVSWSTFDISIDSARSMREDISSRCFSFAGQVVRRLQLVVRIEWRSIDLRSSNWYRVLVMCPLFPGVCMASGARTGSGLSSEFSR